MEQIQLNLGGYEKDIQERLEVFFEVAALAGSPMAVEALSIYREHNKEYIDWHSLYYQIDRLWTEAVLDSSRTRTVYYSNDYYDLTYREHGFRMDVTESGFFVYIESISLESCIDYLAWRCNKHGKFRGAVMTSLLDTIEIMEDLTGLKTRTRISNLKKTISLGSIHSAKAKIELSNVEGFFNSALDNLKKTRQIRSGILKYRPSLVNV